MQASPTLDHERLAQHRLANRLQSFILLLVMVLVLGLSAQLIFGGGALFWVLTATIILLLLAPQVSPWWVLRLYHAQPMPPSVAPDIDAALLELARRAGLFHPPDLYYIPSRLINAFAVGSREQAAIAVTDGLLRTLSPRELLGVLAHEVSHVQHNDMWVMNLADLVSRATSSLSLLGQILILLSLTAYLFTGLAIPWLGLLLLVFAPSISALLQLALSRAREFNADLGAVRLTADPEGLAAALAKLERQQTGVFQRLLIPGRYNPDPSLLRSHPATRDRIQRLLSLSPRWYQATAPWQWERQHRPLPLSSIPRVTRRPRHHLLGLWH